MFVSPTNEKHLSVMIISLGNQADESLLKKIKEIDGVNDAKYVHLSE